MSLQKSRQAVPGPQAPCLPLETGLESSPTVTLGKQVSQWISQSLLQVVGGDKTLDFGSDLNFFLLW